MVDLDNMVQALDNALYVSYDGGNETFYVWHGGHTINLYDAAWNALDAISTGDFKSGITTLDDVKARIAEWERYLATGDETNIS